MATDIAFSLGVLSLLGSRVPIALKVFLTAVAIIDDIGAVIVIAVFYTGDIAWGALGVGAALLVVLSVINMLGVRSLIVYAFVGVLVWFAFLESGVHATVAGVLVAATVPIKIRVKTPDFVSRCRDLLALLERCESDRDTIRASHDQKAALQEFETVVHQMESPLHRFEHLLTPYVAFFIMPLFALANAGVHIQGDFWDALLQPINLGIVAGLVIGKQVGIALSAWASIRWGIAELPFGVSWRHLYGVGILGGIGFTMSLFISNLAFTDGALGSEAKIGILVGSLISGVIGFLVLRFGTNSTAVDSVVD
jgi:NhaA family Na+:H+ antiporter